MKIVTIVLLVIVVGLGVVATGFIFSTDHEMCRRADSRAAAKLKEAEAAQGTLREADLTEEARMEVDSMVFHCRNARSTRQSAWLAGAGSLTAMIGSVVLLAKRRRRDP